MNNQSCTVTVANPQGLHARPVMRFVDVANQYEARIQVKKGDFAVDGKNPMEMMLLEASQGTTLEILAEGNDASEALSALVQVVETEFKSH